MGAVKQFPPLHRIAPGRGQLFAGHRAGIEDRKTMLGTISENTAFVCPQRRKRYLFARLRAEAGVLEALGMDMLNAKML